LTIDQTKNYGTWNLLGTFDFTNDGKDSAVITNNANGYVIADAFRFECMSSSDVPPPLPPNPPQQSSPQNGALHQPTTLNIVWKKAIGSLKYHLQIAADSSFQTLIFNDSSIIDTVKQVASLSNAKTYYWRVRASNSYGTGSWSIIWKFRTIDNLFITGAVLFDKNNNRSKDPGDAGLAAWKVYLQGVISDSASTGIDGSYIFNNLPTGSYTIRAYVLPGWTQTIPSQPQTYSTTLDTMRTSAVCNFLNYASSVVKCDYMDGWNTVSLPVNVKSGKQKDVFPSSTSSAFYYQTSYMLAESLRLGLGYWLKFQQSHAVWIAGSKVINDTIDVINDWNLIGSISDSFPAVSLTTTPNGIISSYVFGFINGLVPVDTIIPGKGYWVKTNQSGKLMFSKSKQIVGKNTDDFHSFELMNSITFCLNNSQSRKIFFTENINSEHLISRALLPPSMGDIFDVRFFNEKNPGSFAALLENSPVGGEGLPIILRSATYPLTIKWQVVDPERSYELESNAGEKIILHGNGEIILEDNPSKSDNHPEVFTLKVLKQSESVLPSSFSLTQNYPNPFNNRTSISLSLPKDSHVRLEVYNILGKRVTTWLDKDIEAGNHILYFEASELASGVYFYRVVFNTSADSPLTQIKRMILVK
jgi:hypothetical protein